MYSLGVPVGIFVDRRGPRPFVFLGAILLAVGYFPLHIAYDKRSGSVAALCFFSYLSGLGGCMAFAAAVKTSAINWPSHRGTATAFPLAAFGLSAFFFSFFGAILFPGDTSAFLKLLAWGTFCLTLVGFFFLKVYPHSHGHSQYRAVPHGERRRSSSTSTHLRSSHQGFAISNPPQEEPGTSSNAHPASAEASPNSDAVPPPHTANAGCSRQPAIGDIDEDVDETSSLMSGISDAVENVVASSVDTDRSHRIDIRGMKLLRSQSFWLLFVIMAILSGVGLMTIK